MSATQAPVTEGDPLFKEILAVHAVMPRGAELVVRSFTGLAGGAAVDTKTLVTTVQWFVDFVRRHRRSEDELLWPVLRERCPEAVRSPDLLDEEDDSLAEGLDELESGIARISEEHRVGGSVSWGHAMKEGTLTSRRIRDGPAEHFAVVEPLLRGLLRKPLDEDVLRFCKAAADGARRGGPHLVFGLLEHSEPIPGRDHVYAAFPPPVRWARGMLVNRFRGTLKDPAAD
ncbi:hemerythrin domain-containing protein [Streptomyces sp. NPDC059862]|uniref:hemerythrin domain-containing protein n=1 Tax=unclassified Streptomyces TaxID=2593676 RepID=UPI00363DEFDC